MKVWVGRNGRAIEDGGCISIREVDGLSLFFSTVNKVWFKKNFGLTPRKGSCKQYELSFKEIE